MTVGENIAFPLEIKKVSKKERLERAEEFAKLLRIEDYFTRKPSQLSGGQQQRVAIARRCAAFGARVACARGSKGRDACCTAGKTSHFKRYGIGSR